MSYYNPKIYNSKNLHEDDAIIIRIMDIVMEKVLSNASNDLRFNMETDDSTLNKIKVEEGLRNLVNIWERYKVERQETIVAMIDNYDLDENIEEKEPDILEDLKDLEPNTIKK